MVGNRTTPAARNPSRGPIQSPKSIQAPDPWMGPIQMDGLPTQQPSDRATRLRLPPGVSDLATQRALFHYAGAISVGHTAVVRAWNSTSCEACSKIGNLRCLSAFIGHATHRLQSSDLHLRGCMTYSRFAMARELSIR